MVKNKLKKNPTKKYLFGMTESDFSKDKVIEGAFIRPVIMMIAFFTFVIAMFMLLAGDLKWGGSLIIVSFILNLYSIYESLSDEKSIFKTMNLIFKFTLFLLEIIGFNWALTLIIG